MTATRLLDLMRVAGCDPEADGDGLAFFEDVLPRGLGPYLRLLQTGVCSLLMNRPWYGIDSDGHGVGVIWESSLNPAFRLPASAVLLIVGGRDHTMTWDRINPLSRIDCPDAFEGGAPPLRPETQPVRTGRAGILLHAKNPALHPHA